MYKCTVLYRSTEPALANYSVLDLFLAVAQRGPLDHQGGVLGDEPIIVCVGLIGLRVGDDQVEVGHLPEPLLPDDGPLEVPDAYMVAVARDGLVVQVEVN